jgi:hypothetical protein
MTDRRGRAARWNTALLLVPGTAAMFGASVAWAAQTTPHTGTTSGQQPVTSASPAAAPRVDPRVVAQRERLQHQLSAHRRHTTHLARRLAHLRAQAAKVGTGAPVASGSGNPGGSGGGSGTGGIYGPVAAPPPPVQQAAPPPPPPPPPVNANTGASGHP